MTTQSLFLKRISLCAVFVLLLLVPKPSEAKNNGGDKSNCNCACACSCNCTVPSLQAPAMAGSVSHTQGNVVEQVNVATTQSAGGPTMKFSLIYNSYNADASRAAVDTVAGYGWTHSYNIFLFDQLGAMFRFDGEGRITRYKLGPGGTYIADTGYFETLVRNPDGSFTLTKKDQTIYRFAMIPGTPFLVGGPVWRLTNIVDRNGNTTRLTYTGGNLTGITDTYGRSMVLSSNAQNKLASITDSAGRVTSFQYDVTGHKLTTVTDPTGNGIRYSYNTRYQITSETDKAGRTFSYSYVNDEPVAVQDSNGTARATLSNPINWATDANQLAMFQLRVYIPSTTSSTDGRGNVWKYQYDSNGYITAITAPDGATTNYSYDPATLQLASMTDANGHTTSYQYDAMGNRLQMTDALGHVTKYSYEPIFNMMTSMTDPRGRVTRYNYDARGNRIQEIDPLGQTRSWTYDAHGNILSNTDQNGHTTTHQYDAFGDRAKTVDPLGNVSTMTYDAAGNMLSGTDSNLHTTSYQYDGMNRLTKVTDATGHSTQTFYDGEGNRIQVIDRNNHSTSYQYDLRQRLTKVTDALGNAETYTYDGNDNRTSLTDRNGHTTTYQYDVQNRPAGITDALGDTTVNSYDGAGNTISETDANGHTTTYTYDALNRRISMTDAAGDFTQYRYDTGTFAGPVRGIDCFQCGATPGSSLVTGQIDANGSAGLHAGVTYFKYDGLDRLIIKVRKVGCIGAGCPDTVGGGDAITTYNYDPAGNRLTLTEPDGNTTTYQFDADNRRTKETNAAGDVTMTTYDGVGNVVTVTAPNLNVAANTYDALNRVTQSTDSAGPVSSYSYDAEGNRLSQTDGNGNTTIYNYDPLNRLMMTIDPLGKPAQHQYDAVGNLLRTVDRNNNPTSYSYDAINRRASMTDALGNSTQYQYDAVGNLVRLTDANGHATLYAYDTINRPVKETYADTRVRSFTYDGVGNRLTRTDQMGQITTYTYNDLYFLVGRAYPSAINDAFSYDLSGRMLTAQRGGWPVSFTYDGGNRVTQTVQNGRAINYSYNIPGRTRTVTYPGGRAITEHTDARIRLDHIDDGASLQSIVQYSYDPGDRVTNRGYRNGTSAVYSYNADDWILNLQHARGVTPIAGFNYAYDNEGNKRFENKLQDSGHSEGYQYDNTYRLINYQVGTLVGSTVPAPSTQTAYNLDPVGNWNSKTTDAVTQSRQHDAVNALVKIDSSSLTYDANGNLQNDSKYIYAYDEENRLARVTRVSDATVAGQYQYDALGRRVQKIANPAGVPMITLYYYDGGRIVEEEDSIGTTQGTYVYGNYIDEVLTMDRSGQTYYYHQNALWSVEAITDINANTVERYAYDAYGSVTVSDGSWASLALNPWGTAHSAIGNPWMFTGRQLDEETGTYFYRARAYDPAKGRFLQRDPFEYRNSMNLYEYVSSRPTDFVDPLGLVKCKPHLKDSTENPIRAKIQDKVKYYVVGFDILKEASIFILAEDSGVNGSALAWGMWHRVWSNLPGSATVGRASARGKITIHCRCKESDPSKCEVSATHVDDDKTDENVWASVKSLEDPSGYADTVHVTMAAAAGYGGSVYFEGGPSSLMIGFTQDMKWSVGKAGSFNYECIPDTSGGAASGSGGKP